MPGVSLGLKSDVVIILFLFISFILFFDYTWWCSELLPGEAQECGQYFWSKWPMSWVLLWLIIMAAGSCVGDPTSGFEGRTQIALPASLAVTWQHQGM